MIGKCALLLMLCLLLGGCGVLTDPGLASEISEILESSDVQLVTEYYHQLQEVNIEFASGDTRRMVYSYPEASNQFLKNYIGCTISENGRQVQTEEYTRDGKDNIISIVAGSTTTAFDLTYDEHEQIIKRVISVDGVEQGWEAYDYNEQGLVTEVSVYHGSELASRTVTEYDDSGIRTGVTRFDGAGNLLSYDVCAFDPSSYQETVFQYDGDGTLQGRLENTYNSHFLLLIEEAFDAQGNLISKTTRRYFTGTITYDPARGRPGA